ncbi:MAG TPA: hypothetical protein VLC09_08470 [Polyangiaceae bacterium]|nr:hypothetical protein [Polyangiaceae bacterium]
MTATCQDSNASCVSGKLKAFNCKSSTAHYCNDFQPGTTSGWWGGWEVVAACD